MVRSLDPRNPREAFLDPLALKLLGFCNWRHRLGMAPDYFFREYCIQVMYRNPNSCHHPKAHSSIRLIKLMRQVDNNSLPRCEGISLVLLFHRRCMLASFYSPNPCLRPMGRNVIFFFRAKRLHYALEGQPRLYYIS